MKRHVRLLRDVEGFEAAVSEVVSRCAPFPFKRLCQQAGQWGVPDSIKVATPALVYNLAVGIDRNERVLHQDTIHERLFEEAQVRRGNVIPLFGPSNTRAKALESRRYLLQDNENRNGAPWLPEPTDGLTPVHPERRGFEPTVDEFRSRRFGVEPGPYSAENEATQ